MKTVIPIAAAIAATLALAGCGAKPAAEPEPAPVEAPASAPLTPEENAQAAAASIDPVFADPATWEAALTVAQTNCELADADVDNAFQASLLIGMEQGVTAEQIGITWGIAFELYCPEYEGIVNR